MRGVRSSCRICRMYTYVCQSTHPVLIKLLVSTHASPPRPSAALSCSGPPTNPELFQATIFHDLLSVPGIPHSPSEIFKTLVETFATDNFIGSFTALNVLAVMFLSTVFGLAIARVHPAVPGGSSRVLVDFVVQLREVRACD